MCVWSVVDGAKEGRRWVQVNVVQRWPSILPHLTRCSRTHAHHPSGVAPPIHPSCVSTDSCCVSLFMSGVVFVWVSLSLALRCSLSLSLCPLPFLRHTHAGYLIHRVYDHLASPWHRGCVVMNTMRVGYNSNTGGHLFHSDLQDVRRRSTMKGFGGGGGVGLTYMRIYRVGQRGGSAQVCVESCGRSERW